MPGTRSIGAALAALCALLASFVAPGAAAAAFALPGAAGAARTESAIGAGASAADRPAHVFKLPASNGFTLLAEAVGEGTGGGRILVALYRQHEAVFYLAPARVTESEVDADLGSLGRVELTAIPSGVESSVQPPCLEEPFSYEPVRYEGAVEFRGEQGFATASATVFDSWDLFWVKLACDQLYDISVGAPEVPGLRLRAKSAAGQERIALEVKKKKPRSRTWIEVTTKEVEGRVRIERVAERPFATGAFRLSARTATVAPGSPFSGTATFRAKPAPRWRGNLAVDLPGRANVPLAGPRFAAELVRLPSF